MLVPALRRFATLLVVIAGGTGLMSILFGLLLEVSLLRSIAIGFYLVGCFLLLGGFFFGNLGPARPKRDTDSGGPFGVGTRQLRWATREEHEDAINTSAVLLPLGFVLILLGVASDTRHALF